MYLFIDVYKADDKIATSGATSLADIDLRRTYRAIDSVATGRIPSLFCGVSLVMLTWPFTAAASVTVYKVPLMIMTHQL